MPKKNEKWQMKEKFGFALSLAVNESFELRKLLKEEALKMFNKDYETRDYIPWHNYCKFSVEPKRVQ